MAIEMADDCVGCAECIGCSRRTKYKVVVCDGCGSFIEDRVYLIGGEHYCEECALDRIDSISAEDLADDSR